MTHPGTRLHTSSRRTHHHHTPRTRMHAIVAFTASHTHTHTYLMQSMITRRHSTQTLLRVPSSTTHPLTQPQPTNTSMHSVLQRQPRASGTPQGSSRATRKGLHRRTDTVRNAHHERQARAAFPRLSNLSCPLVLVSLFRRPRANHRKHEERHGRPK